MDQLTNCPFQSVPKFVIMVPHRSQLVPNIQGSPPHYLAYLLELPPMLLHQRDQLLLLLLTPSALVVIRIQFLSHLIIHTQHTPMRKHLSNLQPSPRHLLLARLRHQLREVLRREIVLHTILNHALLNEFHLLLSESALHITRIRLPLPICIENLLIHWEEIIEICHGIH